MNRIFRKLLNISFIACALIVMYSHCHATENIKVLIINEIFPKIPEKEENIQKLGSVKGDLLVMGTHYTGTIDVWKGDNSLYIINELPLEDYVKDVVAVEIRPDWEMEALKAQAVISRTYALFQKRKNGNSIYHIASSVIDQVYKGNTPDIRVSNAVEETKGEILTFNNSLIEAFYHSTCGGMTEDPEDVFGKSYPYLKSVESPCDLSPYSKWEKNIDIRDIEEALNLSDIQELSITSYTATQRVKQIEIRTNSGHTTINATDLRKALGWKSLPSTNFSISRVEDSIVFKGKGYGHGVGLCQWGALQMAREGKNYKEILAFYYPGTVIQLYEGH
jgi:stage II sporulation protein D